MKRKILLIVAVLSLTIFTFSACGMEIDGSIKSITKPYIAQYECVEARYGEIDLLENYDFIRITFLDKKEVEISYKKKDGEKHSATGTYSIDPETRELEAELGLLGYKFKEKTIVKNGQFTLSKIIGSRELVIIFRIN